MSVQDFFQISKGIFQVKTNDDQMTQMIVGIALVHFKDKTSSFVFF